MSEQDAGTRQTLTGWMEQLEEATEQNTQKLRRMERQQRRAEIELVVALVLMGLYVALIAWALLWHPYR